MMVNQRRVGMLMPTKTTPDIDTAWAQNPCPPYGATTFVGACPAGEHQVGDSPGDDYRGDSPAGLAPTQVRRVWP